MKHIEQIVQWLKQNLLDLLNLLTEKGVL